MLELLFMAFVINYSIMSYTAESTYVERTNQEVADGKCN